MIDDFISEETEGQFRAGSLFVKSSSPPQAIQAVSDSCIHENTVSGAWTKAIKWTHCGMDLSTLTEGAKEKHRGIENEIVLPAAMRHYL